MDKIAFEVVGTLPNGQCKIQFTENQYSGIIITLGQVTFDEVDDYLKLRYEYDVIESDVDYDKGELDNFVGDFVLQEIESGAVKNNLVYTGGTDEN